jgi:hypothetical protein
MYIRVSSTKNESQQQGISYLARESDGRGGERGGSAGRHISGKVRFRRDRGNRQRYREIQDIETRRLETELTIKILSKAGSPTS